MPPNLLERRDRGRSPFTIDPRDGRPVASREGLAALLLVRQPDGSFTEGAMLGADVLLGARHPLEGSCRTAGDPGAGSDCRDHRHCRR